MHHMFLNISDISKVIKSSKSNNTEALSVKQLYLEQSIESFTLEIRYFGLFLSVEIQG